MIGKDLPTPPSRETLISSENCLQLKDLNGEPSLGKIPFEDINLEIKKGEICGIAGVEGNGQRELSEAILGLYPVESGQIFLEDIEITKLSTRERRLTGISFIPEDRQSQGLVVESNLIENIILGKQSSNTYSSKFKNVLFKNASKNSKDVVENYDVKTPNVQTLALALSGGNQQKFVVGREIDGKPRFLLASQPTRGVDIGAQALIWDKLKEARDMGLGVLLISADLDELLGLSDKLYVIYEGKLVKQLEPEEATPEQLGSYMTGLRYMKVYLKILSFLTPLIALAISFGLTTFILILIDRDPVETFTLMFDYGTTGKSIISILNRSIPLYISAVAVAVGFKMGMFNIGVEGQYILGALIAAQVGAVLILPRPLHVLTIFIVAAVVSGIWAGISGYLKVKKGVHEVISTIMLNYIGAGIVAYLLANIFFEKDENNSLKVPQTNYLSESGQLPPLNNILGLEELPNLNSFIVGAIFVGIFYYWLVWKTSLGFDLRATGLNPVAAKFSGADPNKLIVLAMLISGGIAGLVGMSNLVGYFHHYTIDFPTGLGFAGITVALLGRNHPIGMALGALLISFLERSSQILDLNDIPKEIERIMQGIVILVVVVSYEVVRRYILTQEVKLASRIVDKDE